MNIHFLANVSSIPYRFTYQFESNASLKTDYTNDASVITEVRRLVSIVFYSFIDIFRNI